MNHIVNDEKNKFVAIFSDETGAYVRSGILKDGRDTGIDPFMASFPHLIDVGIMGHCIHGKAGLCVKAGIGCYQSGMKVEQPNMTIEDFRRILRECSGRVNQFALGGRGDPDQHEHFEEILKECRDLRIVPNFTTSGFGLTPNIAQLCKRYCGAVAVSWYRSEYTLKAIDMLIEAGVKTNIHYVLGNNTINEALIRLKDNSFPKGINAVVFLLHKPAGQGIRENVLSAQDPRINEFFHKIDNGKHNYTVGMDSCCVPGIVNFCHNVIPEAIDTCEGARFSCYIDAQMNIVPCSFDQDKRFAVSLRSNTIEQAWNSEVFDLFRNSLRFHCPDCEKRENCMGGCPLFPEIVLCENGDKLEGEPV